MLLTTTTEQIFPANAKRLTTSTTGYTEVKSATTLEASPAAAATFNHHGSLRRSAARPKSGSANNAT